MVNNSACVHVKRFQVAIRVTLTLHLTANLTTFVLFFEENYVDCFLSQPLLEKGVSHCVRSECVSFFYACSTFETNALPLLADCCIP
jgi:hypothetical protein